MLTTAPALYIATPSTATTRKNYEPNFEVRISLKITKFTEADTLFYAVEPNFKVAADAPQILHRDSWRRRPGI
jgi:hypothetical protein